MYYCELINCPDRMWVDEERGCIDLYALKDYHFNQGQVGFIDFNEFVINPGPEVVLVLFSKNRLLGLYYPKSFLIHEKIKVSVPIDVRFFEYLDVKKGDYVGSYKLVTTYYHDLQLKNKDKGLRSAFIKLNFIDNVKEC